MIVPRPYRIPLPDWAAFLLILVPCSMIVVLFSLASWLTYVFVAGVLFFGLFVYWLLDIARVRRWCEFRPRTYCKITNLGDANVEDVSPGDETPGTMSVASDPQVSHQDDTIVAQEDPFLENSSGVMS